MDAAWFQPALFQCLLYSRCAAKSRLDFDLRQNILRNENCSKLILEQIHVTNGR